MSSFAKPPASAFTLVEALITLVAIGVISAIALPMVGSIRESARKAAARQNAKNIAQMSEALAALGVAHVIPDSMGGVSATARLLREGIVVEKGGFAGEKFVLAGLLDDDIEEIGEFLEVQYHATELKLVFHEPDEESHTLNSLPETWILCLAADHCRTPAAGRPRAGSPLAGSLEACG
ncbi:MAG: type II secretion system protein [Verrucomicrobiales bacterium]